MQQRGMHPGLGRDPASRDGGISLLQEDSLGRVHDPGTCRRRLRTKLPRDCHQLVLLDQHVDLEVPDAAQAAGPGAEDVAMFSGIASTDCSPDSPSDEILDELELVPPSTVVPASDGQLQPPAPDRKAVALAPSGTASIGVESSSMLGASMLRAIVWRAGRRGRRSRGVAADHPTGLGFGDVAEGVAKRQPGHRWQVTIVVVDERALEMGVVRAPQQLGVDAVQDGLLDLEWRREAGAEEDVLRHVLARPTGHLLEQGPVERLFALRLVPGVDTVELTGGRR